MLLKRTFISVITLIMTISVLTACETPIIPPDYVPVPPNLAYDVSVTSVDKPILPDENFKVTVTTMNVSGKVLYEKTNSTMYKNGVVISIWLMKDGKKHVLDNNFKMMADDERIEIIQIGEVIVQEWHFSAKTYDYRRAPLGKYTLEIAGIRTIPDFLEIVDKLPPPPPPPPVDDPTLNPDTI